MGALSLLLLAVGAVLTFAVSQDSAGGVDLGVVGIILMAVGVVGVVTTLFTGTFTSFTTRTERAVSADGRHVVEEQQTKSI